MLFLDIFSTSSSNFIMTRATILNVKSNIVNGDEKYIFTERFILAILLLNYACGNKNIVISLNRMR